MPDFEIHPATHARFADVAAVIGPKRPDANITAKNPVDARR